MKLLLLLALAGCAGSYVPPVSVSAGFFGATVTVAEPGFTVPAKVVQTAAVIQPTLMVPASAPITSGSVPVVTQAGETTNVPVVAAPVSAPVLAVPLTKPTAFTVPTHPPRDC